MDENTVETVETEVTEQTDLYEGWEDDATDSTEDWADADESAEEPETESTEETNDEEADVTEDQPESSETAEESQNENPAETSEQNTEADQKKYSLKHLDETKEVTLEEMRSMAQKGWDYDRVRSERDSLKAEIASLKYDIEKLEKIKGDYPSYKDLIDDAYAAELVKAEADNGRVITKEEALKRVKADREANTPKVKTEEEKRNDAYVEFAKEYPNLDPTTIPKSVWDEFSETFDLLGAYKRFETKSQADAHEATLRENELLRKEIETLKQNQKNKERSTGSQKTAGANKQKDPDFEGWNDD